MSKDKRKGRPSSDNSNFIREILLENKNKIVVDGELRGPTDEIWSELKARYNVNKTPKALYTCVSCNRWNLKCDLGLVRVELVEENIEVDDLVVDELEEQGTDDEDEEIGDILEDKVLSLDHIGDESTALKIFLPKDKWNAIEPQEKIYIRTIKANSQTITTTRKYMVLKPGVWTDVFNSAVWESLKWPCSWSFKGNYVSCSEEAKFWLLARAKCGCGNKLLITCPNPPPASPHKNGLSLDVKIWGEKERHFNFTQKRIRKRPYAGEKRIKLGEDMIEKDLKATRVRKEMASEIMDLLHPYPAHIPSNEATRQIKREAVTKRRIDNDPVKAIQLLKYSKNPIYMYAIHEIGMDPFYVHITTPNQLKLYNLYCKHNYSRLIVDATGKLVQKLQRPGNTRSGHIFLYLGVILIPGQGEGLIPVVQMLSERHNSNAIQYWLSEWVRAGAVVPNEVVLDDSAALISATCKALGKEPTTGAYIAKCFNYLRGESDCVPNILIRLDVAHLTNLIRKWPEISKLRKRTKEFYIRVIVLISKATTLSEVQDLLRNIFTVALSESEGISATSGKPTPSEDSKQNLLSKIAGIVIEEESSLDDEAARNEQNESLESFEEEEEPSAPSESLKSWIEDILKDVNDSIVDDGDRDNAMHAPEVAKKLQHLLLILPLWCSALPIKMQSPYSSSIGAYIETEIGQLKNNLLKNSNRVDDFVIDYLQICDGTLKLASTMSPIVRKNQKNTGQQKILQEIGPSFPVNSKDRKVKPTDAPNGLDDHLPKSNFQTPKALCNTEEKKYEKDDQLNLCVNYQKRVLDGNTEENNLVKKTSIVDREDLTGPCITEGTSVEGWQGLSLPRKKRPQGYYWRNNPDFPMLLSLSSANVTKIGILKNGMDPTLRAVKVGSVSVALTNTCAFDAACQIFATSYSDSLKYRETLANNHDVSDTILDVASHMATRGITAQVYKKRASILAALNKVDFSQTGFIKVDCSTDCSSLLRQLKMPPSVSETLHCSSKHCPAPMTQRKIAAISVIFRQNADECMQDLCTFVLGGDVEERSPCLLNMPDFTDDETGVALRDPELSKKGLLCMGIKTRETEVGPHLIIEVISGEERLHNVSAEFGVQEAVKCSLNIVPRQLTYKSQTLYLRGVVGFTPSFRDTDLGHYRGYALRNDGSWEMYDDLRDKVTNIDGNVEINIHLLVYTV